LEEEEVAALEEVLAVASPRAHQDIWCTCIYHERERARARARERERK
jgi:hypothetical protein